ncbi:hypothetical protein KY289_001368 [Solanum tuberosum]|nr:hypothetical protein KY289_001368 [Solanum tuberosum]
MEIRLGNIESQKELDNSTESSSYEEDGEETNFGKSKVVTRRPIQWDEIDFPQEWVIEGAAQPKDNTNNEVTSLHDNVDKLLSKLNSNNKGKEKVANTSIQPPPEIDDFKIKDFSDLEKFLEKRFKGGN